MLLEQERKPHLLPALWPQLSKTIQGIEIEIPEN